jgi:hypothetical protein
MLVKNQAKNNGTETAVKKKQNADLSKEILTKYK